MTPEATKMLAHARSHGGRCLLQKKHPNDPATDARHKTAQWLVDHGYAKWFEAPSPYVPGIGLTGKGLIG